MCIIEVITRNHIIICIRVEYFKSYNCVQANDNYLKPYNRSNKWEYLKLYKCVQIIYVR